MSNVKDTKKMSSIGKFFGTSRANKLIAGVVALAVVITGYTVLRSGASGFFAAAELENGTLTGNAQLVTDSTASNGKAIRFHAGSGTTPPPTTPPPTTPPPTTPPPTTPPPATGTTTCPLPKYPSASCTGVNLSASLDEHKCYEVKNGTKISTVVTHNGDYTARAGETVECMRITGDVEIAGSGVIIRKSEVYGHIKNLSTQSFTIEDSTVGPTSGCFSDAAIGNNNYTATRVYLRGFAEGFRVEYGSNVTVRHSYIKFCNPHSDNHADALQGYRGGSNIIFEHNTVDMRDIPIQADYTTAAVFWSDDSGNNVTFKDNLISGGSYTIRIHVGSGHTVTGNRIINNSWLYGPVSSNCAAINWSDNSIVEIDANYNITKTVRSLPCSN